MSVYPPLFTSPLGDSCTKCIIWRTSKALATKPPFPLVIQQQRNYWLLHFITQYWFIPNCFTSRKANNSWMGKKRNSVSWIRGKTHSCQFATSCKSRSQGIVGNPGNFYVQWKLRLTYWNVAVSYAINRLQDLWQNGMTRCQEYAGVVMDNFLLSVQSTLEQVIMWNWILQLLNSIFFVYI